MTRIVSLDEFDLQLEDGMRIGLGGFWFVRNPMALVDKVISSGAKDLEVLLFGGGLGIERLIDAGVVRKMYFAFHSMDVFGLAPRFRAAAEAGSIEMVEVTTQVIHKALQATYENLPSLPVLGPLGSDFLTSGYPLVPYACPVTGRELYAVPALPLDVALLHVQSSDPAGNVSLAGAHGLDRPIAAAARRTIFSVEEIVPPFTAERAHHTSFAGFLVDDVVVAPGGAYPSSCLPYYATDYVYLDHALDRGPSGDQPAPLVAEPRLERARAVATAGLSIDPRKIAPAEPVSDDSAATDDEIMVSVLASLIVDGSVYTVGSVTPLSMAAYQLAKITHAPDMVLIPFAGLVDVGPYPGGIQLAETSAFQTATAFYGIDDLHDWIYQRGAIDAEIFTPGQIDKHANINNSRIGNGPTPKIRLPGQAGIADVAALHKNLYMYVPRHSRQRFVESVDFKGGARVLLSPEDRAVAHLRPGRVLIVTNLCVMELDLTTSLLEILSLHPGVSAQEVQAETGFGLDVDREFASTELPSAQTLRLIRTVVDPWGLRRLEFVPNRERRPMIREILAREYAALGISSELSGLGAP